MKNKDLQGEQIQSVKQSAVFQKPQCLVALWFVSLYFLALTSDASCGRKVSSAWRRLDWCGCMYIVESFSVVRCQNVCSWNPATDFMTHSRQVNFIKLTVSGFNIVKMLLYFPGPAVSGWCRGVSTEQYTSQLAGGTFCPSGCWETRGWFASGSGKRLRATWADQSGDKSSAYCWWTVC